MRSLTRFDRLVLLILVALALAIGAIILRGDRVGVRVVEVSPAHGATGVASQAPIRIAFDQPLAPTSSQRPLQFAPPLSGAVQWQGAGLTFYPGEPLAPDTTYRVTLAAGLQGENGQAVQRSFRWQFTTGHPRILYMALDGAQRYQLFMVDPTSGEPQQLTEEPFGVWDYAPSPAGRAVAYAALREDQGTDLWAVDVDSLERRQILACPDAACSGSSWALATPDGDRLLYERRARTGFSKSFGLSRLWWLDLASGETVPVFEDMQVLGFGASVSPNGQWLSYVDSTAQGIQVVHMQDGRSLFVPSQMGEPALWSPDSELILFSDIVPQGERFSTHLFLANVDSGRVSDLSGADAIVEDRPGAWSPDGQEIALSRKPLQGALRAQLALMPGSGGEARLLAGDPDTHYGPPAWSPDGRQLLYQRARPQEPGSTPEVWVMDVATGAARPVVTGASLPVWLP